MKWFQDLVGFIKAVAGDSRIPDRDKKLVLALLALIISPIVIIPDWSPIIGMMDDAVMIAIILDYFFNRLDQDILLSHYPWGLKSYARVRRTARMVALLTPNFVVERIWKFKPSIYR